MKSRISGKADSLLANARRLIVNQHLPRIVKCLEQLSEAEIWWRPNAASNSAGNLVLHLCGNVRQWVISGLGKTEDRRERDREFAERGPIPRKILIAKLRATVREADRGLARLSESSLSRKYYVQGYHVTGADVVFSVADHFSYHAGQIIYITKLKGARDLQFTRLPAINQNRSRE